MTPRSLDRRNPAFQHQKSLTPGETFLIYSRQRLRGLRSPRHINPLIPDIFPCQIRRDCKKSSGLNIMNVNPMQS